MRKIAVGEEISDILNDGKLVYSEVLLDEDTDLDTPAECVLVYVDNGYGPKMGAEHLLFVNSGKSVEDCLYEGYDWVEEHKRDLLEELINEELADQELTEDSEDYEGALMEAEDAAKQQLHDDVMYLEFTGYTNRELIGELLKVTSTKAARELDLDGLEALLTSPREASLRGRRSGNAGDDFNARLLKTFTDSYVEAALWSTNDESDESGGEPLDKNYGPSDIAPESMAKMKADCKRFYEENYDDIQLLEQDYRTKQSSVEELAGFEFWLTRNGHGTGFWDADMDEEARDRLTAAAEKFGEVWLYVGDDGMIYAD